MDFSTPDRITALQKQVRDLVEKEALPLEPELGKKSFRDLLPVLRKKRELVKEAGLWCPPMPRELGGMGLSLMEFAHVSEELGRSLIGHFLFNCQAPDIGNMEILLEHGTDEQKERFLGPLVRGEIRSCFSMTEPEHAGSNPVWMSTTAKKDGGRFVIDGHKWFTSSADGAQFAIVMAITNPDADAYGRASQIIVPTDTPGFELVRNISVMGHAGSDYASHAEVRYHSCRVPLSNLLGQEGAGFLIAQNRLGPGRIHHCMRWIGICERAFSMMCDRAAHRMLSPGKALGTRQTVQEWIADSRAEIHAARLMVLHAAWKIDRDGTYGAREEISMIKWTVANTLQRVLDRAIQVHGALGMTDETPLAFWFSHERAARIYDGPDEVHKSVVAKRLLQQHGIRIERD